MRSAIKQSVWCMICKSEKMALFIETNKNQYNYMHKQKHTGTLSVAHHSNVGSVTGGSGYITKSDYAPPLLQRALH